MKSAALPLLCALACLAQLGAPSALPQHPSPHGSQPARPVVPPPAVRHQAPLMAAFQEAAFFDLCPQGPDWVRYGNSCYRFFETSQYWFVAEQLCIKNYGGHLVSIADGPENSFVAKLTYCQSAWTGMYAVHVDKLREPNNYRFTDGTNSSRYHAHDFTSISSIHEPLIAVHNKVWVNKVYHGSEHYVCKVRTQSGGNPSTGCPQGWKHLKNSCYLMPSFTANYIEATFHCSGKAAHLVSVYTNEELRALSLLDLSSEGCPPQLWIGLVKINPCRVDIFSGETICYKWQDRLREFNNTFPAWHPGHPDTGDVVNCALLQDRAMKTIQCHEKHRFVCKKPAATTV